MKKKIEKYECKKCKQVSCSILPECPWCHNTTFNKIIGIYYEDNGGKEKNMEELLPFVFIFIFLILIVRELFVSNRGKHLIDVSTFQNMQK